MTPSTDTIRRVLDLLDQEAETLEFGGKRRKSRRLRRRKARRARKAQRRTAKDRRQITRQTDRHNRQGDRQEAKQVRQQTVRDGRQERQWARQDLKQENRQLRADRGQLDEEPEDLYLAEPEEELEEWIDDDIDDMADLTDQWVDDEVIDEGLAQLEGIAGAVEEGRISPRRAVQEARRTRKETARALQAYDKNRPERRNALRRRTVQSMQSQLAGFGAEPTCAACTEAYGRSLLAGLELAGQQAEVELGFLPFLMKAGKRVSKKAERLARKNEEQPTKALDERSREGGRKLFDVFKRKNKGKKGKAAPGQEIEIGPHVRMRAVGSHRGIVLDLGQGMFLVTAIEAGSPPDARLLKTQMLGLGRRQIEALQSPVGLLCGA